MDAQHHLNPGMKTCAGGSRGHWSVESHKPQVPGSWRGPALTNMAEKNEAVSSSRRDLIMASGLYTHVHVHTSACAHRHTDTETQRDKKRYRGSQRFEMER